jgi:hypothetical protein
MPQTIEIPDGSDFILIVGPQALAAASLIAEAIKEASKPRGGGGGGNWSGKKKEAVGLFHITPSLDTFSKNDSFHVPAVGYWKSGERINFFSPWFETGELALDKEGNRIPGMKVSSIQIGSKTWEKLFSKWTDYNTTGKPTWFTGEIRILTVSVGEGDDGKKFSFLVGVKKAETADPSALQYSPLPSAPTA